MRKFSAKLETRRQLGRHEPGRPHPGHGRRLLEWAPPRPRLKCATRRALRGPGVGDGGRSRARDDSLFKNSLPPSLPPPISHLAGTSPGRCGRGPAPRPCLRVKREGQPPQDGAEEERRRGGRRTGSPGERPTWKGAAGGPEELNLCTRTGSGRDSLVSLTLKTRTPGRHALPTRRHPKAAPGGRGRLLSPRHPGLANFLRSNAPGPHSASSSGEWVSSLRSWGSVPWGSRWPRGPRGRVDWWAVPPGAGGHSGRAPPSASLGPSLPHAGAQGAALPASPSQSELAARSPPPCSFDRASPDPPAPGSRHPKEAA